MCIFACVACYGLKNTILFKHLQVKIKQNRFGLIIKASELKVENLESLDL